MKIGLMLFRFGIAGFLFALGVLFEEPIKTYLAQNHASLWNYVLLYGLPVLVAFSMIGMTEPAFKEPPVVLARLLNALSGLTVLWLLLWCFIWSGLGSTAGNQGDLFVRNIAYFGFLGPLVGGACYLWAWKAKDLAHRTARCLIVIGWDISFMAFLNFHLDPTMGQLKGPGIGGLLVMAGVSLIMRKL